MKKKAKVAKGIQPSLFDGQPPRIKVPVPEPAKKRLSAQCVKLLDMLKQGPVTNRQMSAEALKYTSRLSELRAAGIDVQPTSHDHATGLVVYEIIDPKEED